MVFLGVLVVYLGSLGRGQEFEGLNFMTCSET